MKNFLATIAIAVLIVSCSKKEAIPSSAQTDSTKIIDSINAVRTKINDSIRSKNSFKDFSGNHKFTHNLINNPGTINFKKIDGERDHYNVSGDIRVGKDYVHIQGFIAVVSNKHMNFTGNVSESISENENGKLYIRQGTKTFASKDGGKTYRLQDMVNGSGFVDYIDIHF
ncbi:hypothetical protein JI747_019245 [Chryseobacterium sp. RG1]|uniref:Lipoprotein n=1 Tax=Chryseobacterium tagetis TaxID=2801334 RepID=A0ABS8A7L9_9FLAO|nr:hypothetical protein [Chryseobacterium tagetis]MCA6069308.1 hypothetical protein [Chryseobacterium tagetis]